MNDDVEKKLYEVTATLTYTETTDIEASCEEEARERLAFFVQDDINQGVIDVDAFDLETTAREVSD